MREDIAGPRGASSRPMWETLEGMVREKAQEFIQQIMEEEVTELLGREKSEGRSTVDSAEGYRNGYGKPRRQTPTVLDVYVIIEVTGFAGRIPAN